MYRFWSFYRDKLCSKAPSGIYARRLDNCASQVTAIGLKCAAHEFNGEIVGYVDESCHESVAEGFDDLYEDTSYIAYDYYNYSSNCTVYQESASYQSNGDCEILFDGHEGVIRSAKVSNSHGVLKVIRNMGVADCPGTTGHEPYHFTVSAADINKGVCTNSGIGYAVFYNTSSLLDLQNTASSSSSSSSSAPALMPTSSSGRNDGTIIGLACGGAIIFVAIFTRACWIWKKNKQSKQSEDPNSTRQLEDPFIARGRAWTGCSTTDSDLSMMQLELWKDDIIIAARVPRGQVAAKTLLSCGGFKEIYRGTYNRKHVAIKMLLPEMRTDLKNVNAFLAEAKIMASLTHPNIVRFVGVSWRYLDDLCVLTELMEGGDLRALLKEYVANGHPQGIDHDKIRIAYHVAQALTYLHSLSPIVIHHDLKSKNVLLTANLEAKLTDFGVLREQQENTMTAGVGTMLWMAPEVMMAERHDERADIFSFGVLLSELDLQLLPYSHAKHNRMTGRKIPDIVILQKVVSGALQVAFSRDCLSSVVELGKECIALDPSARPSAPMLTFRLQTIIRNSFST